ncbi:sugar ABC transporter substrate-binding protein [Alicyclobacillus fastidiosus]|uniref:Sugar ABC transporter substrate-binding protein n=1 Tax=Alicyclobacillus fastidiosus TaxID=392011 RepID=A0ABY6ZJP7_9BACL|nr:sugar ABC transporter substrate-binding protein [Alicyclobacillus fastidiosus]WAH43159.1 sugar ABC transporter substrate-binding protein [Alicyclobacillus fastidiosus]GMA65174.1 ABC transporter substrate-binding protein [Alicyclobacillus fastidiosus]
MKNKSFGLLAVGVTGLVFTLSGCGITTNSAVATAGKGTDTGLKWRNYPNVDPSLKGQTITILWTDTGGTAQKADEEIEKEFTQQTGIKVNNIGVDYNSVYNKVMTDVMSNSSDIDLAEMDTIWAGQYYAGKVAVDLTNVIPKSVQEEYTPSALTSVTYDGHIMAVPWFSSTKHFYWNKKLFQEAGLNPNDPPTTYDQLLKDSQIIQQKLGSKGIYASGWSWEQAESLTCDYVSFLGAYGGSFFNSAGQPEFNSPGGIQALQMMQTLYKSGTVDPASLQWNETQVQDAFAAGKIAMMSNWEGMYPMLNDPTQSQVVNQTAATILPGEGNVKSAAVTGSEGVALLQSSKHKAAALEFLEFLASKQYQLTEFQLNGQYPTVSSFYSDPDFKKADTTHTMGIMEEQYKYGVNRPNAPGYVSWSDILNAQLHSAIMGQETPKQALDTAQTKIEQAIKQAGTN